MGLHPTRLNAMRPNHSADSIETLNFGTISSEFQAVQPVRPGVGATGRGLSENILNACKNRSRAEK